MSSATGDSPDLPREGDLIAGKYRVERVLGAGGMGVVVAAHHVALDERVALKFLLPAALVNRESVGRFVREARAAVKIKNEHVARVSDVGELPNGSPYMVMEYLEGTDLAGWLARSGPLPVPQAIDFVLQACEALAEAHTLGIVHRDLKPANLFCIQRADGQYWIKVLDFGISKVMAPDPQGNLLTRTSAVMGSPLYMSPEQMKAAKTVDGRSDVWSLGVILFELLTGRVPFDADTAMELAMKVATDAPPLLCSVRPDAPSALEQALSRCLAKDREQRFQSVAELAIALRDFAPGHAHASVDRIVSTLGRAGVATRGMLASAVPAGGQPVQTVPSVVRSHPDVVVQVTTPPWSKTGEISVARGGRRAGGIAIAGLVAAMLLAGYFVTKRSVLSSTASGARSGARSPDPSASATAESSAVPVATVGAAPSNVAPPPHAPPETAAASAPPGPRVPAASHVVSAAPAHAGTVAARPPVSAPVTDPPPVPRAAPPPGPPIPKVSCDPAFYFDTNGKKIFKPECL